MTWNLPEHEQAILDARLWNEWSRDLRDALHGHYGAFWVPWIDGQTGIPTLPDDMTCFIRDHARDWLRMTLQAEGKA